MLLTQQALIDHYQKVIKPIFLDNVVPTDKPTCVILGGQPGCGKSKLSEAVLKLYDNYKEDNNGNIDETIAAIFDQDEIRKEHPNYKTTPESDRYNKLGNDVRQWRKMLIADAIKEKKNFILEGTFGWEGNGGNEETLKKIKESKVDIKLAVLSVNETISKLGVVNRYHDLLSKGLPARFVSKSDQDEYYRTVPDNIKSALDKNLLDEVHVFGREELMDNPKVPKLVSSFTREEIQRDIERPWLAYKQEREREFTNAELDSYKQWAVNISKKISRNNHSVIEFQKLLLSTSKETPEVLRKQIDIIAYNPVIIELSKQDTNPNLITMDEKLKKESKELKGFIGKDFTVKSTNNNHTVIEFQVAEKVGLETKWHTVQAWDKVAEKLPSTLKSGDYIELQGFINTKQGSDQKTYTTINAIEVNKHTPKLVIAEMDNLLVKEGKKEKVTIEGRLGADAEKREIQTKRGEKLEVVKFSVAAKNNIGELKWQSCTVYGSDIQLTKADKLRKGETVKIIGELSEPFKNKNGETKQDLGVKSISKSLDIDQVASKGNKI